MTKRRLLFGCAVLSFSLIGCAKDDTQDTRSTMTEREKDSLIARSPIPGAKAVNKALTTADSASARMRRIDSAQQSP
jgi:hypothetical protein